MVHYLSRTWRGAPHGGTGFYRERASGESRFTAAECEALAAAAPTQGDVSHYCVDSLSDVCFQLLTNKDQMVDFVLRAKLAKLVTDGTLPTASLEQRRYCAQRAHNGLSSMMRSPEARPHYMADSDEKFELLHAEPYQWNRAVIYEGSILHSAHLDQRAVGADGLSCDPSVGRLTASIFLLSEKKSRS